MTASSPLHPSARTAPEADASSRRRWRRLALGVVAVLAAVVATGCSRTPQVAPGKKTVEVIATTPISDLVTDYQDFTGHLDAYRTIEVRPRVSGYVKAAPFKEGDVVHEGDVLFEIDPRPYENQLNAAKAQLEAAQAQIAVGEANQRLARITYTRARSAGTAVSKLELEQDMAQQEVTDANLKLARANLGTAQANLETAKLNLGWTKVRARFNGAAPSGRVSRRNVDPGNLINADTTVLTTLVIEDPLYAYFDVDERTYLELAEMAAPGTSTWFSSLQFPVLMRLANEDEFTHMGSVNFLDNRVNGNTGTIRMRGQFQNERGVFKSGLFVRIRLPKGVPYKTLLIPDEALQSDQGRKYVYVVNKQEQVEYRAVKLGQAIQGLRVIKEGLAGGERVIVSGMQRVRPKQPVQVKMQAPPRPPQSSLTKLLLTTRKPDATAGQDKEKGRPGDKETGRKGDKARKSSGHRHTGG